MKAAELTAAAKALYERSIISAPSWEQLGDTTRSVWLERAAADKVAPKQPKPAAKAARKKGNKP